MHIVEGFHHCLRPAALRRLAGIAALALGLAGCMSTSDITGSITGRSGELPSDPAELRTYADDWGKRFDAKPGDATTSFNYARALRALGRRDEAVAVLQGAAIRNPNDRRILGAYGKSLADVGRFQEAASMLAKAHTPERPDWSILSAQGTVADQLGNYTEAQGYYEAALRIRPGEPTVLSNLGLSYALTHRLADAETTLRRATASPRADTRVRHNLALVLVLQGRNEAASDLLRQDMTPTEASADVSSIRQMIAQSDTWRQTQRLDGMSVKGRAVRAASAEAAN